MAESVKYQHKQKDEILFYHSSHLFEAILQRLAVMGLFYPVNFSKKTKE